MGGNVIVINSKEEWAKFIAETKTGKVVVVDFFATWCGPCRMVSPYFEELSTQFPSVTFLKVDVDVCESVAQECDVSAMPTFQVWKNGAKAGEVVGASKDGLKNMIASHAP